jgi:hypothetical protein
MGKSVYTCRYCCNSMCGYAMVKPGPIYTQDKCGTATPECPSFKYDCSFLIQHRTYYSPGIALAHLSPNININARISGYLREIPDGSITW